MAEKRRLTRKIRIRKRPAKYEMAKDAKIDYKNLALLQNFLTDKGKILSRRITGVTGEQQRKLCMEVKRARFLGLLPVGSAKKK